MIIFQTAGSSDAGSFRLNARLLGERMPSTTTFRSNDYIHRLNRTLQAEMRAISAYRGLDGRQPEKVALDAATACHQLAGKELVRLIIANRGIPEDRSTLSFGLTRTFIQICARVPAPLGERVTLTTLHKLEGGLVNSYKKLVDVAPKRDLVVLNHLLDKAVRRSASLTD